MQQGTGDKRGSIAVANWLGVQALAFFPVAAVRGRLVTTAVEGGWKEPAAVVVPGVKTGR